MAKHIIYDAFNTHHTGDYICFIISFYIKKKICIRRIKISIDSFTLKIKPNKNVFVITSENTEGSYFDSYFEKAARKVDR